MKVAQKAIPITGATRGAGHALAREALRRGAMRVHGGMRGELDIAGVRVIPLTPGVTNDLLIEAAGTQRDWRRQS